MAKLSLKEGVDKPRAYCMRCKKSKQIVRNPEIVKAKSNNAYYYSGTHKSCGGKVTVRVGAQYLDGIKAEVEDKPKKKSKKEKVDTSKGKDKKKKGKK